MSKPSKAPPKTNSKALDTPSEPSKEEKKPATVFLFAAEKVVISGSSSIRLFSVKNKKFHDVDAKLFENSGLVLGDFCYGHFSKSGGNNSFDEFKKVIPQFQFIKKSSPNSSKACIELSGKIIAADSFTVFENEFSNALYTGKPSIAGAQAKLCIENMSDEEVKANGNKYFFKTTESASLVEKTSKLQIKDTDEKPTKKKTSPAVVKEEPASSPAPKPAKKTAVKEETASSPAHKLAKKTAVKEEPASSPVPKPAKKTAVKEEPASSPAPKPAKKTAVKEEPATSSAPKPSKKSAVKQEPASSPAPETPTKADECTAIVLKVEKKGPEYHHMVWVTTKSCEGILISNTKTAETKAFKGTFEKDTQKKFMRCTVFKEETENPIDTVNKDKVGVFCVVNITSIQTISGIVTASAQYFIKKIVGSSSFKITNALEGKDVKIRYIKHESYGYQWVAEKP